MLAPFKRLGIRRTVEELEDYAARLHHVDPGCKEVIPVTPEEAYAIQEHILMTRTFNGPFSVFDMQFAGHKFKIL